MGVVEGKISLKEYKELIETFLSFYCPIGKDPHDCNGHACPSKPNPPFDNHYKECLQFLSALQLLRKVQNGEIEVR